MKKIMTKEQFRKGMESEKIDVRPGNICYINGNLYELTISPYGNEVELEKMEVFEEERDKDE